LGREFDEERGVIIVGEKTYHGGMLEFNNILYFYHNHLNNDSIVIKIKLNQRYLGKSSFRTPRKLENLILLLS
jgi:hypothetical protein